MPKFSRARHNLVEEAPPKAAVPPALECLLLFIGLVLVYLPALNGAFIMDDIQYIAENALIISTPNTHHFWTELNQTDYWPLFYSTIWHLWRYFGMNTTGYHLVNIAVHAVNAVLFGRIASLYGLHRWRLWAILVFAFHPLAVQSVAWIFQLKTLLSTTFALLSYLFYLRSVSEKKPWAYGTSLFCFACAVLTKSSVIFFPFAFVLHHLWTQSANLRTLVRRLPPFLAISLAGGIVTLVVNARNFAKIVWWKAPALERVLVSFRNFWIYVMKFIIPHPLNFVYEWKSSPPANFFSWLPLVLALAGVGAIFLKWRRSNDRRWLAVLLLVGFFFLNLAPALGFVSTPYMRYSLLADHYTYLSLFGGVLLGAAALKGFGISGPSAGVAWLLPLLFAGLSLSQARIFDGPEPLWKHAVERNPVSAWARFNLASSYAKATRHAEAIPPFEAAVNGPSDSPEWLIDEIRQSSMYGLAHSYMDVGRVQDSVDMLERLYKKNPRFVNADYNLAMIYHQKLGKLDRAEELYEHALMERDPNNPYEDEKVLPAWVNLCNISLAKKDYPKARLRCFKAAKLAPKSPEIQVNLGRLYKETGEWKSALEIFESLERTYPPSDELHAAIGEIKLKLGAKAEARKHFQKALEMNPYNADARKYLSGL